MAPFKMGSISMGTLRTEDLLPAFADALIGLKGTQHPIAILCYELTNDPNWACGRPNAMDVLESLTECLNACCPPLVWFGTRPGGGAINFGFWPDWDAINARCTFGASYRSGLEWHLAECIVKMEEQPRGITIMDSGRNVLWSTITDGG